MTEFVYNNSIYSIIEYISFFATTGRNFKMNINLISYEEQTI